MDIFAIFCKMNKNIMPAGIKKPPAVADTVQAAPGEDGAGEAERPAQSGRNLGGNGPCVGEQAVIGAGLFQRICVVVLHLFSSFVVVRLAVEDGHGAVELLGEDEAYHLVRECHLRERDFLIGSGIYFL